MYRYFVRSIGIRLECIFLCHSLIDVVLCRCFCIVKKETAVNIKCSLETVLVKKLDERNIMLIKGAVPGRKGGLLKIRPAVKGQDK